MTDLLTPLRKCKLFFDIPDEILTKEILPHVRPTDFPKETVIFSLNETVDTLGIIISGSIHLTHLFADGSYSVVSSLKAGQILGADLVCTKTRISPYYATSATACQIISIPAKLFLTPGILSETCRLSVLQHLLTLISHENMRKEYRLTILSQKGLRERILVYLTMQANRRKTNSFTIPFSREELASFLCVNRSALSHELSLMQQEGLIRFHKNKFTLLQHTDASISAK